MITIRKAGERGHVNHGWLDTYHTFSFADYYDPQFMGFRSLRVINEDVVAARRGFDLHPHRDMEIITYVIDGELAHKDSLGHGAVISPGEVQVITAGSGILHSEHNSSSDNPVHLLQIWIVPSKQGLRPAYNQKRFTFPDGEKIIVASKDGQNGSLPINQDASLSVLRLKPGQRFEVDLREDRGLWIQMVKGDGTVDNNAMAAGDGAAIEKVKSVALNAGAGGMEALLFDLS